MKFRSLICYDVREAFFCIIRHRSGKYKNKHWNIIVIDIRLVAVQVPTLKSINMLDHCQWDDLEMTQRLSQRNSQSMILTLYSQLYIKLWQTI